MRKRDGSVQYACGFEDVYGNPVTFYWRGAGDMDYIMLPFQFESPNTAWKAYDKWKVSYPDMVQGWHPYVVEVLR